MCPLEKPVEDGDEAVMRPQKFIAKTSILTLTLFVMLARVGKASAMDQASIDNVQAAMRTLSFLQSLSKDGPIVVGVVYSSDTSNAQVAAEATAQLIGTLQGPNSRALQPQLISTSELSQFQGHLDVLFLMVGASNHSAVILDCVRRHHLVSLSDDPLCVKTQCCVITVGAGPRVEISLNTALADAVGARFSLVFTMVVKRK
jgi:hypothetical protein